MQVEEAVRFLKGVMPGVFDDGLAEDFAHACGIIARWDKPVLTEFKTLAERSAAFAPCKYVSPRCQRP
jgi:hypothetical protein